MLSFIWVTTPTMWRMFFGGEPEVAFSWYFFLDYFAIWVAEFFLVFLLVGHLIFVCIDRTTIEWRESQHMGYTFSYWGKMDMWYTCAKRTLGTNPLLWFLPTRMAIEGDGVNFHKPFFRGVPKVSKDDPNGEKRMPEAVHSDV